MLTAKSYIESAQLLDQVGWDGSGHQFGAVNDRLYGDIYVNPSSRNTYTALDGRKSKKKKK